MGKWPRIILFFVFCIMVVLLAFWSKRIQMQSVLSEPEIYVQVSGGDAFLTEEELLKRLKRGGFVYDGQRFENLKLPAVEKYVESMTEVKSAKAYAKVGNRWNIDVEIRKPICRIFNKHDENFYLDDAGFVMEPSELYTARVVVVTGEIYDSKNAYSVDDIINNDTLKSSQNLDDIYRISKYVCNDPFLSAQIGQIELLKNGDFILIPQVGGQKIVFGTAKDDKEVAEKFKKLIIFYKEGLPYEGWNTYDEINLKFKNQIVCRKKNKV